jgi:hypothetical protein
MKAEISESAVAEDVLLFFSFVFFGNGAASQQNVEMHLLASRCLSVHLHGTVERILMKSDAG